MPRADLVILEELFDQRERFCSLDELAGAARISPGAVDGALDELRRRGHRLEFSPSHGVRLEHPVRLDSHLIERGLGARRVGRDVLCFDEVDSTNDVAFDSARQGNPDGLVVLAESQRRGRGRQGRQWLSPPGKNLLMSVLLTDPAGQLAHDALTVAGGLAVAEGIEAACPALACRLKWPNDVLLDGEKTAGVLVEIRQQAPGRCVVVGVGVNVNACPPPERVDHPATSLAEQMGQSVERIDVAREIIRRLDEWVERVSRRDLADLHTRWVRRCGMINQRVSVDSAGQRYVGRVADVHPLEGLILFDDDGRRVHLPAEYSTLLH